MSIETMTKLATVTVGAGGSANVTFSNIPQTYTDLRIVYSSRDTNANSGNAFANINLTINGDSLTNYSSLLLYGLGTSVGYSNLPSASGIGVLYHPSSSATSSTFSSNEVNFLDYSGSNHKIIISDGNALTNSASPFNYLTVGKWTNTSAITSINLQSMTLFNQHSTFTLYGIKNVAKTAGNSIKAIGGNISFDGTYVVHTFTSSGTFTPTSPIPDADFLVVAGGGGGGGATNTSNNRAGGGGGAGGYKCSVPGETSGAGSSAQSRLGLSPYVNYLITVGAGGARGTSSTNGTNGSDSFFHTIQSYGGGGGGRSSVNGNTGGSGGGGGAGGTGGTASTTGGAGLGGNGYAGGNSGTSYYNAAPGGGGAGAAGGGLLANQTGGLGGNGLQSRISGTPTYYAGGGGGGAELFRSTGGLGGGGRGALQQNGSLGAGGSQNAEAGTTNTGGGGGGSAHDTSWGGEMLAAAGGSGIVIIRYKG